MFFAKTDNLASSSTYKVLLYFIACVAMIFMLFIHQVFVSSEAFYHKQLERELTSEASTFSLLVSVGDINKIYRLIEERSRASKTFFYRIQKRSGSKTSINYPVLLTSADYYHEGNKRTEVVVRLSATEKLIIGINPNLLRSYRDTVTPILLSGIAIPVILMLAGATLFSLSILKKLARVNQGMSRVISGEKGVKLPESSNDDEFNLLTKKLNFLIEQVEKNESSLKDLSVGMAHDLRTPIARIKLRLEKVLAANPQPYTNELEACHDDLETLLNMFNGLLEISRLNSGKQDVHKEIAHLDVIAQDAVEFLTPLAEEKQQELIFRVDSSFELSGEPSLLFRAVYNLVENAIKYTPKKGTITVVVDPFGLVVVDTGMGVSSKDKLRIKEPMFRADASRTKQGYGLGLSLVDAVVQSHGGELVFSDNKPGLRARILFSS
ncbi:TPA: sensor histidine kinase [Photobacterium damselae]